MQHLELAYSKDFILISLSTFDYFTGLQLIAYWKPVNVSWLVLCSEFANIFFYFSFNCFQFCFIDNYLKNLQENSQFPFFNLISHRAWHFKLSSYFDTPHIGSKSIFFWQCHIFPYKTCKNIIKNNKTFSNLFLYEIKL